LRVDPFYLLMKLRGSLTAHEFAEVRRMSRTWKERLSWFYRPRAGGLLLLFLWMTAAVVADDPAAWWKMCLVWLVIAGIAAWATVNRRKEKKKALENWNAQAPQFIVLSANGLSSESTGKTTENLPWTAFERWREGKSVFLLFLAKNNHAQPLPKSDLNPQQLQELRDMLDLYLRPVQSR
jgi:hypothetical protein